MQYQMLISHSPKKAAPEGTAFLLPLFTRCVRIGVASFDDEFSRLRAD